MAQARCKNGHIYDSAIYGDRCPYCDHGTSTIYFNNAYSTQDGIGATVPGSMSGGPSIMPEEIGKTMPPKEFLERQQEIGGTVGVFQKHHGSDPVVGWLVCVKGHDKGLDYRLRAKTNLIGRSREMDIQIKGDDTVSSDTHAKIDYDVLNNQFYLIPANNRNTIYCNGSPVYAAQKLSAYDRLRLGDTEVLFVPFCCEHFTWSEGE